MARLPVFIGRNPTHHIIKVFLHYEKNIISIIGRYTYLEFCNRIFKFKTNIKARFGCVEYLNIQKTKDINFHKSFAFNLTERPLC
jgi:hypothetical protein